MTKPIVKAIKPHLYTRHVKHMEKASVFTYNYANMDDYIKEHYYTKTREQIAHDLNEYVERIAYRIQVLKENKLLMHKLEKKRLEAKLKMLSDQHLALEAEIRKTANKLLDA